MSHVDLVIAITLIVGALFGGYVFGWDAGFVHRDKLEQEFRAKQRKGGR